MYRNDTKFLLESIVFNINKIEHYLQDLSLEDFLSEDEKKDAIVWNFHQIGVWAARVPQNVIDEYDEVAWYQLIAFKERLIHDFFGADYAILYQIYKNSLPLFKDCLLDVLIDF